MKQIERLAEVKRLLIVKKWKDPRRIKRLARVVQEGDSDRRGCGFRATHDKAGASADERERQAANEGIWSG